MLSLSEALRTDRLQDFIRQQEVASIGPIDEATFDLAASKVIKPAELADQTSRSSSRDGSTGKRTR